MAIRINYNPMSVLTNANLTRTDRKMSAVLDRLSSGERLRRSADDPASLVVANAVRYHRTGVDRARSNAEEAVTMLQTAEGGMDQITQVLQRLRTLAVSSLSPATTDARQLASLQADLDAGVRSITTIATSTTYGTIGLLDGSLRDNALGTQASTYYSALRSDYTALPGGMRDGDPISIAPATGILSRPATIDSFGAGTAGTTPVGAIAGSSITLTGPAGSTTLAVAPGTTIDGLAGLINSASSITGIHAAYDAATGQLRTESMSYGSSTFTVSSTNLGTVLNTGQVAGTGVDRTIDITYVDAAGVSRTVTLQQDPTSANGLTFTNTGGGPEAVAPFSGFGPGAFSLTVLDPNDGAIGATISPAGVTPTTPAGITVEATRTGTTAFQIGALSSQRVLVEIPDLRAGALGHSAGLAASASGDWASLDSLVSGQALVNGNGQQALDLIDAAIDEVLRARGSSGALQGNTVERVMDSLSTTANNLRDFESILRDVDMAAESAEYARVQVMMQAATAMLAQANQVPQTVLQLLK